MTKVLICDTHGGFGLSRRAFHRLRELGNEEALAEPDYGERWPNVTAPGLSSLLHRSSSHVTPSPTLRGRGGVGAPNARTPGTPWHFVMTECLPENSRSAPSR
jgi:hypothetical protein